MLSGGSRLPFCLNQFDNKYVEMRKTEEFESHDFVNSS